MALKDKWVDRTNDEDLVLAEDINDVANAVIALEDQIKNGVSITVDDALSDTSENPVQNKVITQVVQEAGTAMEQLGAAIQTMAQKLEPAVSIDMSAFDSEGKIVETFADGTSKATVIEFDEGGNPVKITDGDGNVTVLTW